MRLQSSGGWHYLSEQDPLISPARELRAGHQVVAVNASSGSAQSGQARISGIWQPVAEDLPIDRRRCQKV
jgi:hypothetical protein